MKLDFIPLDKLSISTANMRHGRRAPDVADILPTVRARGVLQPIIVRPRPGAAADQDDGGFEIVAGARRFHAARLVAGERRAAGDAPGPMPCAILDEGDDAAAVEASLIENMARLDPDEVRQWETFTRLVREGRTPDEIAATFGLPELAVRRILALGNLLPRIRDLYRRDAIDAATVRHLTMASKSQQRAWLALADDGNACCPTGHRLKAWLCGGQPIAVAHALFDIEASGLATIADLFGEDRYFADADAFWTAQHAAIEARRAACIEQGWADAIVVPPAEHFSSWEYEKAGKRKGGRVYFDVRASGEVIVHEGYISRKEAQRRARAERGGDAARPARPEITGTMQTYVDLHRHAAVRAALAERPGAALRLMVAHAIAGSPLWSVRPEPRLTRNEAVRASVTTSPAEAGFAARRAAILAVLGLAPDEPAVTGSCSGERAVVRLFSRLLDCPDSVVAEVAAVVMGETLAAGSAAVEATGSALGVDMARVWRADDAFFALLRDREVLTRIVAELAGESVAAANAGEKGATLRRIVRDTLDGAGGRSRVASWVPRWMAFPPGAYTARGGVGTIAAHARAEAARTIAAADDEPDPGAPGAALDAPAPANDPDPAPQAA